MSVELQKLKRSSHLTEWAEMVRLCKNSGLTVRVWCKENGLNEKTYYHRQKQVCDTLPDKMNRTVQFAEVSPASVTLPVGTGIQIRIGAAEIRVDGNSDLAPGGCIFTPDANAPASHQRILPFSSMLSFEPKRRNALIVGVFQAFGNKIIPPELYLLWWDSVCKPTKVDTTKRLLSQGVARGCIFVRGFALVNEN